MKTIYALFIVLFVGPFLSSFSLAQTSTSTETLSLSAPAASTSPIGFSYIGLLQRNGRIANSHYTDALGNDQYTAYSTDLDTENHFKFNYKFANGDIATVIQRIYYSVTSEQKNWEQGGEVPFFAKTRLEYLHNIAIGNNSSIVIRADLPTNYDYYYNQNLIGNFGGIANLNWDLNPKITLGMSTYAGVNLYGGSPRSLSPWQEDAIARNYSNDWTADQNAAYLAKTGEQRDSVYFNHRLNFTYNFDDKLSFTNTLGYGVGLKDTSDNFSHFSRATAFWEIFPELDYQMTKAVSFAFGASQVFADMPGSSDLSNGKSIYYNGNNFALFRPEETSYYLQVGYVY